VEIMRRGLRMAPGRIRRRELHHLPPIRLVVLFFLHFKVLKRNPEKYTKAEG